MTDETKKRLLWVISDYIKAVASVASALAVVSAAVWWLFGKQVIDIVEHAAGTGRVMEQLAVQAGTIGEINESVQALRVRVDESAPLRVAEYDELRSKVHGPCVIGEACEYTYRVRRTHHGESCETPRSTRVFVDSSGVVFFPGRVAAPKPAKLNGEWSAVVSDFRVPNAVVLGVGEFYLELEYTGCDFGSVNERSLPLQVEIIAATGDGLYE